MARNLLINPTRLSESPFWLTLDEKSQEIIKSTVDFFEKKGLARVKHDFHERIWYRDFIDFQKSKNIFYQLMTPGGYGDGTTRWDSWRNSAFNEVLGFYGLSYWYTWQVSMLGLGPIWISHNEGVKRRTADLLKSGEIFAFGLSEKEHGADIYSSEMKLVPSKDGFLANGRKYYIGNANEATLVSTLGKMDGKLKPGASAREQKSAFVFFAVNSKYPNYQCVQNTVKSQSYVAEYALNDYPVTEADILSQGEEAWDASLNTINFCKFNLGWASIGIATHAFYEAIAHASARKLYGTWVTDFPHIRQLFVDSYARLSAMKLFAMRASDYMRAASPSDRRYLLFNPMVKMKVTTQGEEVVNLLWDVIAARGFEKDLYFEMATSDIRCLPKLEGTVHVNMALIIKFMENYLFKPARFEAVPRMSHATNDDFLFNQGTTSGLKDIRFHDYRETYRKWNLPNVRVFKSQVEGFRKLLMVAKPSREQTKDFDFLLNLGEMFTLVAYGHLILESAEIEKVEENLVDQIFDFLVRDFSMVALRLSQKPACRQLQSWFLRALIRRPVMAGDRALKIWTEHVASLRDAYRMQA